VCKELKGKCASWQKEKCPEECAKQEVGGRPGGTASRGQARQRRKEASITGETMCKKLRGKCNGWQKEKCPEECAKLEEAPIIGDTMCKKLNGKCTSWQEEKCPEECAKHEKEGQGLAMCSNLKGSCVAWQKEKCPDECAVLEGSKFCESVKSLSQCVLLGEKCPTECEELKQAAKKDMCPSLTSKCDASQRKLCGVKCAQLDLYD